MGRMRRLTRCRVPGHGTRCEPAQERDNSYPRSTEERRALQAEERAMGD